MVQDLDPGFERKKFWNWSECFINSLNLMRRICASESTFFFTLEALRSRINGHWTVTDDSLDTDISSLKRL